MARKVIKKVPTSIAFRVTPTAAAKIAKGYNNLNDGAQSACLNFNKVRTAEIKNLRNDYAFDSDDIRDICELEVPENCSKIVLVAIAADNGLKVAEKLRQLTESSAIILVDMIRKGHCKTELV